MQDEETRSWWQQVTGEAIFGPLKGRRLDLAAYDELTLAAFRREHPDGRVLRVDDDLVESDWEAHIATLPVVTPEHPDDPLEPRAVVIGVSLGGIDKAYPLAAVVSGQCLQDTLGGVPIALVASEDGKSVRGFAREVDGQVLDLFAKPESTPRVL